jgi:hypothetical protein
MLSLISRWKGKTSVKRGLAMGRKKKEENLETLRARNERKLKEKNEGNEDSKKPVKNRRIK